MKYFKRIKMQFMCVALAGATALGMAGCESYGQAAGLGAGIGAASGAIIGHQSGHALEGAAIGAALGAATGAIAQDIKFRRQRSRAETEAAYNYQPAQGEMLTFEETAVLPPTARPGELIETSIQYALLGTGGGVQVSEQRVLMRGDRVIAELSTKNFTRDDGTWVSTQPVRLAGNMAPGYYTIRTRVTTAQSAISGNANFTVQ